MIFKPERTSEFQFLCDFIEQAFATAPHSEGDEHLFVARLRASADYIPELALVAELDREIVAHILFTRIKIAKLGDAPIPVLLLAPLCVRLDCRGKGVGSALVRETLRRSAELGHRAVLLVGNPAYYSRFGFVPANSFGLANTNGYEPEAFQALELVAGELAGGAGTVAFPH